MIIRIRGQTGVLLEITPAEILCQYSLSHGVIMAEGRYWAEIETVSENITEGFEVTAQDAQDGGG